MHCDVAPVTAGVEAACTLASSSGCSSMWPSSRVSGQAPSRQACSEVTEVLRCVFSYDTTGCCVFRSVKLHH
jgi:hypothetical protein